MANNKRKAESKHDGSLVMPKKRKTSATDGDETSAASETVIDTKPRVTFLSLPRELRQAIFVYAMPDYFVNLGGALRIRETVPVTSWKTIHTDLIEDVAYAEKKWWEHMWL